HLTRKLVAAAFEDGVELIRSDPPGETASELAQCDRVLAAEDQAHLGHEGVEVRGASSSAISGSAISGLRLAITPSRRGALLPVTVTADFRLSRKRSSTDRRMPQRRIDTRMISSSPRRARFFRVCGDTPSPCAHIGSGTMGSSPRSLSFLATPAAP